MIAKFYYNQKQNGQFIVDDIEDNRYIHEDWKLIGKGDVDAVNDFTLAIFNKYMHKGKECPSPYTVMREWMAYKRDFPSDTSYWNTIREGDVLQHRGHKKLVIVVLENGEWGYMNKGSFVPFYGCEKYANAIRFKDGTYFDLDYCTRLGNVFDED